METNNQQEPKVGLGPPRECFEDGGLFLYRDQELYELQINNEITGAHFPEEGGVLMYRKGDKFPSKGWPFGEAVLAADVAKRSASNMVKFLISSPVRYFVPLFFLLLSFLKKKIIYSAVSRYADFTNTMIVRMDADWKPLYFCTMAREIYRAGMELAGEDAAMKQFVKTVCMVFEFDDAYRYRMQDLFGEIHREDLLTSPAKELARVFKIAQERGTGTAEKFGQFAKLLPILFSIKCIREPLLSFFSKVDLEKLVLDENDWYRCLIWGGYSFGGIPDEQRISIRMMIDAEWQATESNGQPQNNLTVSPA